LLLYKVLSAILIKAFDNINAVHVIWWRKYKNISSVPEQFLDERHQLIIFPILSYVKKLIAIIICKFHTSFYLQQIWVIGGTNYSFHIWLFFLKLPSKNWNASPHNSDNSFWINNKCTVIPRCHRCPNSWLLGIPENAKEWNRRPIQAWG
jgi:hypothetical protein